METERTFISTEQLTETGNRRSILVKTLVAAAAGLIPASLMADSAVCVSQPVRLQEEMR